MKSLGDYSPLLLVAGAIAAVYFNRPTEATVIACTIFVVAAINRLRWAIASNA